MARNWKEYQGGPMQPGRNEIYATLNFSGEIVINRHAFEAMQRPKAVALLFEPDTDTIGLRPTGRLNPNAFPVKPKGNCDNQVIRSKPFCAEHDIRIEGTVRFRTAVVEGNILVLDLRMMTKVTRTKKRK